MYLVESGPHLSWGQKYIYFCQRKLDNFFDLKGFCLLLDHLYVKDFEDNIYFLVVELNRHVSYFNMTDYLILMKLQLDPLKMDLGVTPPI